MSKATHVGVGGTNLAAAVVRMAAGVIVMGGLTGGPGAAVATAQAPVADGAFTADQASSGWSVYGVQCGQCHGPNLEGMIHAPPLSGVDFLNSWLGQTTDDMFAYLRDEMPPGQAGVISDQAYIDLVAYLLESNGAVPGERILMADAGVPIGDAADMAEARRAAREGDRPRRRPVAVRQPGGAAGADSGDRRAACRIRRRATGRAGAGRATATATVTLDQITRDNVSRTAARLGRCRFGRATTRRRRWCMTG